MQLGIKIISHVFLNSHFSLLNACLVLSNYELSKLLTAVITIQWERLNKTNHRVIEKAHQHLPFYTRQ